MKIYIGEGGEKEITFKCTSFAALICGAIAEREKASAIAVDSVISEEGSGTNITISPAWYFHLHRSVSVASP